LLGERRRLLRAQRKFCEPRSQPAIFGDRERAQAQGGLRLDRVFAARLVALRILFPGRRRQLQLLGEEGDEASTVSAWPGKCKYAN
jgi:hypothetical protein